MKSGSKQLLSRRSDQRGPQPGAAHTFGGQGGGAQGGGGQGGGGVSL